MKTTRIKSTISNIKPMIEKVIEIFKLYHTYLNLEIGRENQLSRINEVEKKANIINHDLIKTLYNSFPSNLMNDDIISILNDAKEIYDIINDSAIKYVLYKIDKPLESHKILVESIYDIICDIYTLEYFEQNINSSSANIRTIREKVILNKNTYEINLREIIESFQDIKLLLKWTEINEMSIKILKIINNLTYKIEKIRMEYYFEGTIIKNIKS